MLIGQQVAIKLLHVEDTSLAHGYEDGVAYDIFLREAMAIANLDHPHILPLYKYGEIDVEDSSFFYLVMPLCLDGTLAKWLERSGRSVQLSPLDAEHFVRQAASALQYAHDHDIIHQDVKPSKFLLRPGKEDPNLPDLLLADFGCAEFIHATTTNVANRTIRGTPAYMAPEQWGGYLERATDQYALGVMSYQMLTAQLPFSAPLEQNISLRTQPQAPSTLNPNLSTELDEVVLHALARRPQDRFPSIAAFAHAFQRAAQHRDTSTVANTSYAPGSKEITTTLAISEAEAIQGTNTHVGGDEPVLHADSNELTFQSSFPVTFGIPAVINSTPISKFLVDEKRHISCACNTYGGSHCRSHPFRLAKPRRS